MKLRQWLKRSAACVFFCTAASLLFVQPLAAAVPYEGYMYDGYGDRVPSPVAYVPGGTVTGESLGIGEFRSPEDMVISPDNRIYIADTGNNRIVELDSSYRFVRQIDSFDYEGSHQTFNKPEGLFVTESGELYVADTGNYRVVRLSLDGSVKDVITAPKTEFFASDFIFMPRKLAVDSADRLYVIAKNVFDGIMQFDGEGNFVNFYAANRVKYNVADYVWKRWLSTDAQRERMVSFVPTEYTNLDVDEVGFIFTTSTENTGAAPTPIKRHNPTGTDVLLRQGNATPMGDLKFNPIVGPSRLVDIDVGPDGVYSALDERRGRIFTYDSEGKLLYIFGGAGERVGTFKRVSAIERQGDSILVLDKDQHRLTYFEVTRFGDLVNQATHYRYIGDEAKASELWREILTLDANYDLAYSGVSKAQLRAGEYEPAVKNAKLGLDRHAYSRAYQHYRKSVLKEHFSTILTSALILLIVGFIYNLYRKWTRRRGAAFDVDRAS